MDFYSLDIGSSSQALIKYVTTPRLAGVQMVENIRWMQINGIEETQLASAAARAGAVSRYSNSDTFVSCQLML